MKKILYNTYPMAFHASGGGEMQLLKYKEYFEEVKDINVEFFNQWNPNFKECDVVHFFSLIGGSYHFCNFVKQLNLLLVISYSLWITNKIKHLYPVDEMKYQLLLADKIVASLDVECKQISKVLDILNLVKAMTKLPDYKLVLIGYKRDEKYAKEVLELDGKQVIYASSLEYKDPLLRSAYSACEVFSLPSTLETPGLAALEAAAIGCKISITEVGATKEYFKDYVHYCDPSSDESIVNSIIESLKNTENILSTYVYNNFRWSMSIKGLKIIYKEIKQ